jgi:hypothetical protein
MALGFKHEVHADIARAAQGRRNPELADRNREAVVGQDEDGAAVQLLDVGVGHRADVFRRIHRRRGD